MLSFLTIKYYSRNYQNQGKKKKEHKEVRQKEEKGEAMQQ